MRRVFPSVHNRYFIRRRRRENQRVLKVKRKVRKHCSHKICTISKQTNKRKMGRKREETKDGIKKLRRTSQKKEITSRLGAERTWPLNFLLPRYRLGTRVFLCFCLMLASAERVRGNAIVLQAWREACLSTWGWFTAHYFQKCKESEKDRAYLSGVPTPKAHLSDTYAGNTFANNSTPPTLI